MINLHYYPGNASFITHVLLREIGVPFELRLVDRAQGAHKTPEYLRLNPNGLLPVLQDGDLVLYETAAICLHLVDTHPAARLAPPLGTVERAYFFKWLVWLTNTVQADLIHYFYPHRMVDEGNAAAALQVKAHAEAKVVACLAQIEHQLGLSGGPWMAGADYSVVDIYAFMLCRWTRGFSAQPARGFSQIATFLQRMTERPAVQQAFAAEQLSAPFF